MGMRFEFYSDPIQQSLWKTVITRIITHHDSITFGIQKSVYDGKLIKYGKGMISGCFFNPLDDAPKSTIVNWTDYISTWKTKWAKNGLLAFNCKAYRDQQNYYAGIQNIAYGNISLYGNDIYYYGDNSGDAHVRMALIEIDNEDFIAFYVLVGSDPSGAVINALVVSLNVFDGSYQPRYTPPTTPDIDGGYGTGETPNGEQAGVGTQGGGDHISVYPPNVDVNVEINMPEPDKVQRAQPSNINLAVIDGTSLNALISALWGKSADGFANLWQQFENYKFNPMAGVVKCMKLPFWVVSGVNKATAPSSIGIAGTTILGFTGKYISNPIVQKTYSIAMASQDEGIPFTRFNDFKDFVGVSVQAYAPFVGWFDLDPSLCFGGGIDFKYTCDASNGNIAVEIWGTSVGQNDTQKHYQLLASGGGNCAYDIIISGNDNGMGDKVNGFSQIASGVVTTAVGLVTENVPAAAAGALGIAGGAVKATNAQQQTVMVGNISGSAGYLGYLIPFVRVIKPRYVLPDAYESIYGRPVSGGAKVSDFEGCYAELDIKCTDLGFANAQEQQRIISYLENGVIV